MKKLLIIGLCIIALTACTKKDDVVSSEQVEPKQTTEQVAENNTEVEENKEEVEKEVVPVRDKITILKDEEPKEAKAGEIDFDKAVDLIIDAVASEHNSVLNQDGDFAVVFRGYEKVEGVETEDTIGYGFCFGDYTNNKFTMYRHFSAGLNGKLYEKDIVNSGKFAEYTGEAKLK